MTTVIMSENNLFDDTPLPAPTSLRSKRHDSKPRVLIDQSEPKNHRPIDNFTAPLFQPYVIQYLTIETPHTDTFVVHGPHRTFAALIPAIRFAVSGSPSAILKLTTLSKKPGFENTGFTTFVIDLERRGYTVLHVVREVNVPVFDTLPAPVYVVTAHGPVYHDLGTGVRTVASGKPKGIAATSKVIGIWVTVDQAREAAKHQMDMLVHGEEGIMRMERGEMGGNGRWILMGMSNEAVWEVSVRYDDDVLRGKVGGFDDEVREGKKAKFRF